MLRTELRNATLKLLRQSGMSVEEVTEWAKKYLR